VTLLHLPQRLQHFDKIFAPLDSLGTRTVCIKIFKKIKEVLGDRAGKMERV